MSGRVQFRENTVSRRALEGFVVIGRLDPRVRLGINCGVGSHVVNRDLIWGDSNKWAKFLVKRADFSMRIASKVVPKEPEACQLGEKGARYAMERMKENVVNKSKPNGSNDER